MMIDLAAVPSWAYLTGDPLNGRRMSWSATSLPKGYHRVGNRWDHKCGNGHGGELSHHKHNGGMILVEITQSEYLKLVGLLTLASHHNKMLEDIRCAVSEITKEEDGDMGHSADAVYGQHDAKSLLDRLNITVEAK